MHGASFAPTAPPPNAPSSYEVRVRRGLGGAVSLIGHDRSGEPMVELRLMHGKLKPNMVRKLEEWCRANDDAVDLRQVP